MANLRHRIKKQKYQFADEGLYSQSYAFPSSHGWMWELDNKESWAPKNWCLWIVVLEKTSGLQGDPTSQSERKSILNVHWKDWCWSWNSNTLATWCEELTHWKRPWCWERLEAGGEGDDRGCDGWMPSLTQVSLSKLWELMMDREAWRTAEGSHTWPNDWTDYTSLLGFPGGPSAKKHACQCRRHKWPGLNCWVS